MRFGAVVPGNQGTDLYINIVPPFMIISIVISGNVLIFAGTVDSRNARLQYGSAVHLLALIMIIIEEDN